MEQHETYYEGNGLGYEMISEGFNRKAHDSRDRTPPPPGGGGLTRAKTFFLRRQGISWRYPAAAAGLYICSLLLAVGHDLYYVSLNGTLADNDDDATTDSASASTSFSLASFRSGQQTWALRIGLGLSFLSKTAMTAVVGFVGVQQLWLTLRHKAMTVRSIDNMYGLFTSPLTFFDLNVLAHAKVLVVVALLSWFLPLVTVVTPATLSVTARGLTSSLHMPVPSVNMSDSRHWVNALLPDANTRAFIMSPHFEMFTLFTNMLSSAASGLAGIVPISPAPYPNASYELSFFGPSYKCMSLSDALALNDGKGIPATWQLGNPSLVGDEMTNYTTFEEAFYAELSIPRPNATGSSFNSHVYAGAAPLSMFNTLLVSTSGVNPLWDDGTVANTSNPNSMLSSIVCQLYNTSFDVTIQFVNGIQSIVPHNVHLLEQQAWSGEAGIYALDDPCLGVPEPSLTSSYGDCGQATATFYATHLLFSYLIKGFSSYITSLQFSYTADFESPVNTIPFFTSALVHCPDVYNHTSLLSNPSLQGAFDPALCRNHTLAAAIEDMSRNFTYSLLAFKGWTTPPTVDALVTHTNTRMFFVYARTTLWAAYATALGTTLMAMLLGVRALMHNHVVSSASFSSTLLTTRNPELRTALFRDSTDPSTAYTRSIGALPRADTVGAVRLRFGHLVDENGTDYAGFGIEGNVRPWARGE
ncbi:MAG: hypothetical protein STHCBS139747_004254 [Sporothrix thermara]